MSVIANLFNRRYRRHLIASDIPYDDKSTLDIYRDITQTTTIAVPVIILWHGGSWRRGDKALYPFVADYLARSTGALIILPNYQHYPDVTYPHFIDEGWQVVNWVTMHAREYGGDPAGYSVIGNSAGAHTSTFISLGFRKPPHLPMPQKSVDLAGPTYTVGESYWPIFDIHAPDSSRFPVHYVSAASNIDETQYLIVHGRHDRIVAPEQSEKLFDALATREADVTILRPKVGHLGLILGMGSPFAKVTVYARQVVKFLNNREGAKDEGHLE